MMILLSTNNQDKHATCKNRVGMTLFINGDSKPRRSVTLLDPLNINAGILYPPLVPNVPIL